MINPHNTPLGKLFKSNSTLSVPKYQRSFDWGKSEVLELMDDLMISSKNKIPMFLGTFVFDISDKENYKIVDGQQRITSLTLLLITCRQLAKKLEYHSLVQQIQNKISFTDETTGEMISERIIVSSSIADVFNYICDEEWNSIFPTKIGDKQVKRQSNKLKPLFTFMYSYIENFGQSDLSNFLRAVYDAYVIEIDIEDQLEAFDIFERTNARGLSLNVADLIKNYLFQNSEEENYIEEKWNEIVLNAGTTLQRMLKYYWVSKHGSVSKKNLYRKLKSYAQSEGTEYLTDGLWQFSIYYKAIQSDDIKLLQEWLILEGCEKISGNKSYLKKFSSNIQGLNHFNITQHFPLIYSIISAYKKTEKTNSDTKIFLRLIDSIEKYHFVNNQICDRVGNEIEKPYAEFSDKFSETKDFKLISNDFLKLIKNKLAKEDEFTSRFIELDYSTLSLANTCYIFDRINNNSLNSTEWLDIYDPDKSILQNNYNTEHFLSQNPDHEVSEIDMEVVDNIGNLFIISRHTNSKLQNKLPKDKLALLKDSSKKFRYISKFIDDFEKTNMKWGAKEIKKRSRNLAEFSYKEVWKIK